MNKDMVILNQLVIALDDSCNFYTDASHNMISPNLKFLAHQFIHTHAEIADDLAERGHAQGMQLSRKGSTLGRWRARYAEWLAIVTPDIDLGYLTQTDRYETRLAQQFATASDQLGAQWPELQQHQRELERMQAETAILARKTQSRSVAR